MPTSCAVADCEVTTKKNNTDKNGKRIPFHRFPLKNEKLTKIWSNLCRRKELNVKNATICDLHFTPDDFKRDLRNELLGLPVRKILKPGAIPSIFPNRKGQSSTQVAARKERVEKRKWIVERKNIVNEILNNLKEGESSNSGDGGSVQQHEEKLPPKPQKPERVAAKIQQRSRSSGSTANLWDLDEHGVTKAPPDESEVPDITIPEPTSPPNCPSPQPDPEPGYFQLTRNHLLKKLDSLWDIVQWKNRKLMQLQRKVDRLESQLNIFKDRTEELKKRNKTDEEEDEFLWDDDIKVEEGLSADIEIDDKENALALLEKSLAELCKFNKIQLQEELAFQEKDGEIRLGSSTIKTKTLILPTTSSCNSQFIDVEENSVDPLEDATQSEDLLGNKGACCEKHRQMFKKKFHKKMQAKPSMTNEMYRRQLEAKPKLIISWKCNKCNELFKTKIALRAHTLQNHPFIRSEVVRKNKRPKRECPICKKKGFRNELQLENHVQRHTGIICMFCGKSFKSKHGLLLHEKQHEDDDGSLTNNDTKANAKKKERTAYTCSSCEFTTLYKNSLTSHTLRFHTDNPEISNTCEYCGKGFLLHRNYKRHLKQHEGGSDEGGGMCNICGKFLKNIKKHMYDVHSSNKPMHECPYCDKKFKRKTHVTQHLQYSHRSEQERDKNSNPGNAANDGTSNEPGTSSNVT